MDRIEQVKNLKMMLEGIGSSLSKHEVVDYEALAERFVAALCSEPQVCPKPEQMMICPTYSNQDPELCKNCSHKKEHPFQPHICDATLTYCQGCIPVPSTPASEGNQTDYYGNTNPEEYLLHGGKPLPPELLTPEEWHKASQIKVSDSDWQYAETKGLTFMQLNILSAQLLKCQPLIEAPLRGEIKALPEKTRAEINKALEGSGLSIGRIYDGVNPDEYTICDPDGDEVDPDSLGELVKQYMNPDLKTPEEYEAEIAGRNKLLDNQSAIIKKQEAEIAELKAKIDRLGRK